MENITVFLMLAIPVSYYCGWISRWSQIENLSTKIYQLHDTNESEKNTQRLLEDALGEQKKLFKDTLAGLRADSVFLPSLARWSERIQEHHNEIVPRYLENKTRPAVKAAEEIRAAQKNARQHRKAYELAIARMEVYEKLAPWIESYLDINVSDFIESMNADTRNTNESVDPIEKYVPKTASKKLSKTQKYQMALDRYLDESRRKSLWRVGIDYERYVGYQYEKEGYRVDYHGAVKGKQDMGIDLICMKENELLIVQCKRLSTAKKLPVRENTIAQVYGAACYYALENETPVRATPVLVTTYKVSPEARKFAKHLGVLLIENYKMEEYPTIKCNVSKGKKKEKIYHLPMDQSYDRVIIGDEPGEFFALTVREAEKKGFRRAWKWQGNAH